MRFPHSALPLCVGFLLAGCALVARPHARGNSALQAGDYPAAIEAFSEAIEAGDAVLIAHINRGIAYEASGQSQKAVTDYDAALAMTDPAPTDTQRAEILNNRGVAYMGMDKHQDDALEDLSEAIELRPDYAEAYANRGRIYVDRESYQEAIADFDKAIELSPELTQAYGNRGLAYQNLGDDENATRDYSKAIDLSQDPQALWNRGMLRYALGCFNLAYEDFSAILERADPNDPLYFQAESQKLFLDGRPKVETTCRGIEGQRDGDPVDEDATATAAALGEGIGDEATPDGTEDLGTPGTPEAPEAGEDGAAEDAATATATPGGL
ncbi:MAG: tetratricopeptide repeat protein [Anaerolineae bacterium]|jgi:tetratricopeptide (TPR) repeat protein|nr:tetratricopeptide repeat protein [Ardenticatenia bacterium]MBK8540470.1 tetratricopeptide repeat protein [Ardenticatenia bacterium]HQZ70717.1 tetratricopeptide repeat protein [Anaerolineae bacterium]HRA19126.1 tetratricopeptide repeat protein [Anaerolineae bacterium]